MFERERHDGMGDGEREMILLVLMPSQHVFVDVFYFLFVRFFMNFIIGSVSVLHS